LHKWCLWISDFQVWFLKDGDECPGVRVNDTAKWIGCIIVKDSVIKDLDAWEARNRRKNAIVMNVWNTVRWRNCEGRIIGLDTVAP